MMKEQNEIHLVIIENFKKKKDKQQHKQQHKHNDEKEE
jgi:hypothetical protein